MPDNFSDDFYDDEIGFLARNLEHASNEMQAALEREKRLQEMPAMSSAHL